MGNKSRYETGLALALANQRKRVDPAAVPDRTIDALRRAWIAACRAEVAPPTPAHVPTPGAWWLEKMLARHPLRIDTDAFTPQRRTTEPDVEIVPPCGPNPSRITRCALEVFEAPMLHELLHLWSAAADLELRQVLRSDGAEFAASFRKVAAYNMKASDDDDEQAWWRDQRDRSPKEDRQVSRERLSILEGALRTSNWSREDIARLILDSEHDWLRPPIRIADHLRAIEPLVSWIREELRADRKNAIRRR